MAFDSAGLNYGNSVAAADLSLDQYRFVKLDTSANIALVSASGGLAIGVLQNTPKSAQTATLRFTGVTKIVLGATVASGAAVMSDSQGRAITYVNTENANPLGFVINGGVVGDIAEMFFFPTNQSLGTNDPSAYIALSGKQNNAGGSATITITATGVAATDEVFAQIQASTNAVTVQKVTPTTNTITVLLSGDPGASTVISWLVVRASV